MFDAQEFLFDTQDEASSLVHPPPLKYAPSCHAKLRENTQRLQEIEGRTLSCQLSRKWSGTLSCQLEKTETQRMEGLCLAKMEMEGLSCQDDWITD